MGQIRKRGDVWWIRYYRNGRRYEESARTTKLGVARHLLKLREGGGAKGIPVTPKIGRLRFDDAIMEVVRDYQTNAKASVDEVERRIAKHLLPFCSGRRMADITTDDIRAYVTKRQADREIVRRAYTVKRKDGTVRTVPEHRRKVEGVSNAEINRELTTLKRAFTLALQAGTLMVRPYIPLLDESNARQGFFERDQFEQVRAHLPEAIRPVVSFAYVTG